MNVRITSLKVFVDLAETGSFSETASHHGISQPAVSQQIGGLEEEFSAPLVERSRRRFRLTPAGEALLQTAKHVLTELDSLKIQIANLKQNFSGAMLMATTSHLGIEWLPRLETALRASYPHISLEASYRPAGRVYADVIGNVADFALVTCPVEDDRYETVVLAEEPFLFVTSTRPGRSKTALDLKKMPFVAYAADTPTAGLVQRKLQELDFHAAPILHFDHPDSVLKALQATHGFTCLPLATVKGALAAGELMELFPDRPKTVRRVAAVFLKQRMDQPVLQAFRGFLETFAQQQPDNLHGLPTHEDNHREDRELSAA